MLPVQAARNADGGASLKTAENFEEDDILKEVTRATILPNTRTTDSQKISSPRLAQYLRSRTKIDFDHYGMPAADAFVLAERLCSGLIEHLTHLNIMHNNIGAEALAAQEDISCVRHVPVQNALSQSHHSS